MKSLRHIKELCEAVRLAKNTEHQQQAIDEAELALQELQNQDGHVMWFNHAPAQMLMQALGMEANPHPQLMAMSSVIHAFNETE